MNVTSGRRAHHADRPKRATPDSVPRVTRWADETRATAPASGPASDPIGNTVERDGGTPRRNGPEGVRSRAHR